MAVVSKNAAVRLLPSVQANVTAHPGVAAARLESCLRCTHAWPTQPGSLRKPLCHAQQPLCRITLIQPPFLLADAARR